MDQPPIKPLDRLEKLLGVEWIVVPTHRELFKKPGYPVEYRQNHVTVTDPNGKKWRVSRHKSNNQRDGFTYLCDDGDCECEHVMKAREYWAKKRG